MIASKRNIFKHDNQRERSVRKEFRGSRENTFIIQDKKKIESIIPNDSDFPELVTNNSFRNEIENKQLDYKIASLKEVKKEEDNTYKLPEGWVSFTYDNNKQILIDDLLSISSILSRSGYITTNL